MESLRAIHFANEFQPNHCALHTVGWQLVAKGTPSIPYKELLCAHPPLPGPGSLRKDAGSSCQASFPRAESEGAAGEIPAHPPNTSSRPS